MIRLNFNAAEIFCRSSIVDVDRGDAGEQTGQIGHGGKFARWQDDPQTPVCHALVKLLSHDERVDEQAAVAQLTVIHTINDECLLVIDDTPNESLG